MKPPPPIQAYFDADSRNDGATLIDAFAPGAVVRDEGRSHAGRQAIHAWWHATKARYQHTAEPLETSEKDGIVKVVAKVSGRFPGSPATLLFAFQVKGDQITGLEISA